MLRQLSLALVLVVPALALAGSADPHAQFKQVTVAQVAQLQKARQVTVVDANNDETRAKYGKVPGALLLSSHKYEPAKELPADKGGKLVFYCSNTQCTSAPGAAKRAVEAGYTDVAVMPEGIMGWVKAGQQVEKVPASASKS